ncbi:hypothetical protein J2Y55_002115 [Bosea sp. BE125]|uniref:hypothetical protein n=1 Tax=Bosea sp. BE125 TaxID=2817909 RepID=UPI00285E5C17|nr:hypothetical protein [Bosea sp. BE125]MDR6871107.1 hypothetical protein [Bosea sp. BE125]
MARHERAAEARPFSIRLTDGEKAALQAKAGRVPLGAYARKILLGDNAEHRDAVGLVPRTDAALLARMLAMLGESGLADSLNTLARHAEAGALIGDAVTIERLHNACDAIVTMRLLLLHALGKRILDASKTAPPANPEDWL